jgi:Carbohydrate esterase, sialic acid-specific acetylesterase
MLLMTTFTLMAPAPRQIFIATTSGATYTASDNAVVTDVAEVDVVNLLKAGCWLQSGENSGTLPNVNLEAIQYDFSIFQRSTLSGGLYDRGRGTVPVVVTLALPIFLIEYRLRDAAGSGNSVLRDWTPGAYSVPAGSSEIGLSDIPARLGWYFIDLRPNQDSSQILLGTVRVGVGRVIAAAGQSLCTRMFGRMDAQTATNASLGVAINPCGSVYASYYDGQRAVSVANWALPADGSAYDSTFAAEFLHREIQAFGVNCALVGAPVSATAINTWLPGAANDTHLKAVLTQAGGAWETFLWMQGHSDAQAGTNYADYYAGLSAIFADLTLANGFGGGYTKLMATIPNIASNSWGTGAAIQAIRSAALNWCADNNAVYVSPMDLGLIDGVHESQEGGITLARHFYRATRSAAGLANNDAGPSITGATRAAGGTTIELALQPAGGTGLLSVGAPATRFKVFHSGDISSQMTVASVSVVSPTSIAVELSEVPGDDQAFDVWAFYPPDPTFTGALDMIYDNALDEDGITTGRNLTGNLAPITVAAPVKQDC